MGKFEGFLPFTNDSNKFDIRTITLKHEYVNSKFTISGQSIELELQL